MYMYTYVNIVEIKSFSCLRKAFSVTKDETLRNIKIRSAPFNYIFFIYIPLIFSQNELLMKDLINGV